MIFNSIRWRIQAWHGALLLAMVTGLGLAVHRFQYLEAMQRVDTDLMGRLSRLNVLFPPRNAPPDRQRPPPPRDNGRPANGSQLGQNPDDRPPPRDDGRPPDGRRPQPTDGSRFIENQDDRPGPPPQQRPPPQAEPQQRWAPKAFDGVLPERYYFAIWNEDGSIQGKSANTPDSVTRPGNQHHDDQGSRMVDAVREYFRYSGTGRCFLVGRSVVPEFIELRQLDVYLFAAGAGVLALGWLVGWWISSRAIRPIRDISATAEKIASGHLSQRIQSEGFADELQRLARVLNSTFSRLDAAFTQQAHFTADAAHELRTPVAVMLMHATNGLACDDLTEEQRESFEACQRAAQRMRRLIESLLELARLDAGEESLRRDRFDLAGTAQDCVALVQPLAEKRGVQIYQDIDSVSAVGDSDRVAQVITNLLTNAIEYNRTQGEVNVKLHRENGSTILTVTDTGNGIASADLPHVFERFYRGDTARTGSAKNGLGLAISKAIVEAQGGTLIANSAPGHGATFTMRLPSAEGHR